MVIPLIKGINYFNLNNMIKTLYFNIIVTYKKN